MILTERYNNFRSLIDLERDPTFDTLHTFQERKYPRFVCKKTRMNDVTQYGTFSNCLFQMSAF